MIQKLKKIFLVFGVFSLSFLVSHSACACSAAVPFRKPNGEVVTYDWPRHPGEPWKVEKTPRVVFAFGFIEEPLRGLFMNLFKEQFNQMFKTPYSSVEYVVFASATGQAVVNILQDPNTVGFVFISKSLISSTGYAHLLTSDRLPLPLHILRAATPALRMARFFETDGNRLRRKDVFEQSSFLHDLPLRPSPHANPPSVKECGQLKKNIHHILLSLRKDLLELTTESHFFDGSEPDPRQEGKLIVRAKDVSSKVDPRYVEVNGHIIGVLGSDQAHSSHDAGYEDFVFRVPAYTFLDSAPQEVRIIPAEISKYTLTDDYLIQSVTLQKQSADGDATMTQESVQEYHPAVHVGLAEGPPTQEEILQLEGEIKALTRDLRAPTHRKAKAYVQLRNLLISKKQKLTASRLWWDLNPTVWDTDHKMRFYSDRFDFK